MAPPKPSTHAASARPDFMVELGLLPPYTVEDVKRAYFDRALTAHPDRGGSADSFIKLHNAYTKAIEYAGFRASRMHWLGAWVENYANQQEVIEQVKRLGGDVDLEQPASVSQSIGDDFAVVLERLVGIRFHGLSDGDAAVNYLLSQHGVLTGLRWLSLVDCRASNQAVAKLELFANLRKLDLSGSPVSYEAVKAFRRLRELESLGLERTRVPWWRRWSLNRYFRRRARARAEATPGMLPI